MYLNTRRQGGTRSVKSHSHITHPRSLLYSFRRFLEAAIRGVSIPKKRKRNLHTVFMHFMKKIAHLHITTSHSRA